MPAHPCDRFISDIPPTPADFDSLARRLGVAPVRARKRGLVAARVASAHERVVTHWNGVETENVAAPGDAVVTNLAPDGTPLRDGDGNLNTYVIRADRFPALYEATGVASVFGAIHRAKSTVLAIHLPGGFDILAPWGERQRADSGYLIRNGDEVYGNNAETFAATYELLPDVAG